MLECLTFFDANLSINVYKAWHKDKTFVEEIWITRSCELCLLSLKYYNYGIYFQQVKTTH